MKGKRIKATASNVTVRNRLLANATKLFTQKGYAATTVREIVTAAGVTKPVLYYYFHNKEGIYLELIREAFSKLDALLDNFRRQQGSVTERLLSLSDQAFSLLMENIEVARLMYSIYYGPPQGAPFFDFDSYHVKLHNAIKQLVKEGIRKGEFQKGNVENMMWAILGPINVAIEVQLCHPEMGMGRERVARILEFVFKGISTERRRQEEKRK